MVYRNKKVINTTGYAGRLYQRKKKVAIPQMKWVNKDIQWIARYGKIEIYRIKKKSTHAELSTALYTIICLHTYEKQ